MKSEPLHCLMHSHSPMATFLPGAPCAGVDLAKAKSTPLYSFLLKEAGLGEASNALEDGVFLQVSYNKSFEEYNHICIYIYNSQDPYLRNIWIAV